MFKKKLNAVKQFHSSIPKIVSANATNNAFHTSLCVFTQAYPITDCIITPCVFILRLIILCLSTLAQRHVEKSSREI